MGSDRMTEYQCKACGGFCDPGELVGGICADCRDKAVGRGEKGGGVWKEAYKGAEIIKGVGEARQQEPMDNLSVGFCDMLYVTANHTTEIVAGHVVGIGKSGGAAAAADRGAARIMGACRGRVPSHN